jgi:hypothetical protein
MMAFYQVEKSNILSHPKPQDKRFFELDIPTFRVFSLTCVNLYTIGLISGAHRFGCHAE